MRRFALTSFLVLLQLLADRASAAPLDPHSLIRPDLLATAEAALRADATASASATRLVIVDYSRHSRDERLYVVNTRTGDVTPYRVAHGVGSDPDHDGYLDSFSSLPGSQASPSGLFRLAEEYTGRHGRSARLDGLEATNATARSRAIVIHAAPYAEPQHLATYGKLGRSNGCLVFSKADLSRFLEDVPQDTLILIGK